MNDLQFICSTIVFLLLAILGLWSLKELVSTKNKYNKD
jgi:hypothetical protein